MAENLSVELVLICADNGTRNEYTTTRFVLIMISSCVAVIGLITNSMLIWIFIRLMRNEGCSSRLYSLSLACFDVLLCCSYVVIYQFDALAVYADFTFYQFLSHQTIIIGFITGKFVQLGIPYFIIVSTLERWLGISRFRVTICVQRLSTTIARTCIVLFIITLAASFKLPNAFAFHMGLYPNCSDYYLSKMIEYSQWGMNHVNELRILNFYIGTTIQLFIPFVILLILNFLIIGTLRMEANSASPTKSFHARYPPFPNGSETIALHTITQGRQDTEINSPDESTGSKPLLQNSIVSNLTTLTYIDQDDDVLLGDNPRKDFKKQESIKGSRLHDLNKGAKMRIREVTTTVIVIVTTYLVCNIPHLALSFMEQFNLEIILKDDMETAFYHIFSDIVSTLFMGQSVLRFAIYFACNRAVRREIRKMRMR